MSHLQERIAEEAQLLADEKWIIEALRKLKRQRNSLQVERLQLENLEATLKRKIEAEAQNENTEPCTNKPKVNLRKKNKHKTFELNSKAVGPLNNIPGANPEAGRSRDSIEFEELERSEQPGQPARYMDLDSCNNEELDLSVSKSVFTSEYENNSDAVEENEEVDDDDTVLDMNMFMNSKFF